MTQDLISPIAPDSPPPKAAGWRFWIPMLLQLGLAIGVPAQSAMTYYWGRSVVLQTRPVDPYDWMRGYSQTLSYDISQVSVLEKLPGWETIATDRDQKQKPRLPYERREFYLILQQPTNSATEDPNQPPDRPKPWQPVAIRPDRPGQLPVNQVALRGEIMAAMPRYNLETYYMDESKRDQINDQINGVNRMNWARPRTNRPLPFVVEIRVGADGQAVAHSLWIEQDRYQF